MTKVEYCNAYQNQFFGGLQSSNSQSDDRYLSLYWLPLESVCSDAYRVCNSGSNGSVIKLLIKLNCDNVKKISSSTDQWSFYHYGGTTCCDGTPPVRAN